MEEPSQATYTDSHDELVAHGGLYRDLYERQSSPGKKVRRRRAPPADRHPAPVHQGRQA